MIKFFRKIRQNLLIDGNTTKYFKYAIGEIILVVIGILIALQINTWNEHRKTKILEDNFYSNVMIDLTKDEEMLDFYLYFHNQRINFLDTLLTYVRNPYKKMGIEKFSTYVEPLFYTEHPANNSTTFESAKSLGTFNNFQRTTLFKNISQYYTDFILLESNITSIARFVESHLESIISTIPESYINTTSGKLVITRGETEAFYKKLESIKDHRNLVIDYESVLQNPRFEAYLIGDLGRTFNALEKIKVRKQNLLDLKKQIQPHD